MLFMKDMSLQAKFKHMTWGTTQPNYSFPEGEQGGMKTRLERELWKLSLGYRGPGKSQGKKINFKVGEERHDGLMVDVFNSCYFN